MMPHATSAQRATRAFALFSRARQPLQPSQRGGGGFANYRTAFLSLDESPPLVPPRPRAYATSRSLPDRRRLAPVGCATRPRHHHPVAVLWGVPCGVPCGVLWGVG